MYAAPSATVPGQVLARCFLALPCPSAFRFRATASTAGGVGGTCPFLYIGSREPCASSDLVKVSSDLER